MKKQEYTCTVTFTDGWQKRVTDAFVDLYYQRLQRIGEPDKKKKEQEVPA
ncbi:MAG: hypothetical protein HFI29_05935 [Lachnospiraceae bacterium]|jgi:hypothetical protein|nr:hypothetical protein [Lachnospiraceae bacterium]